MALLNDDPATPKADDEENDDKIGTGGPETPTTDDDPVTAEDLSKPSSAPGVNG